MTTQVTVNGKYPNARLVHVNLDLSKHLADMGRFSLGKMIRLGRAMARSLWVGAVRKPDVLYYQPAGASRTAILRDILMLSLLRPMVGASIFHMHTRGLGAACAELPWVFRRCAQRAYSRPNVILGPSRPIVEESRSLNARHSVVVPCGIAGHTARTEYPDREPIRILFLNKISEAKGASWALEAFAELVRAGVPAELAMVGEFDSPRYREAIESRARELGVLGRISLPGVLIGEEKWRAMDAADVFCFPTIHPHESFGLVLVESASCGLPAVSTRVPGVEDVLVDGESVLLADPADQSSLATLLHRLCTDRLARERIGRAARTRFEELYTQEKYWRAMSDIFATVSRDLQNGS